MKLPSDQSATFLADKGEWMLIEYFDYAVGEPRSGWVKKKYLKRLK